MSVSLTGNGIVYSTGGSVQNTVRPVVKYRYTSATTVDQQNADTNNWYVNGTEISMGVPQKSVNWYRCEWYSCLDDVGANQNAGCGFSIWRYTPSSGWNLCNSQGVHAMYDNNDGDFYTSGYGIWHIPVHQTYPTEEHRFRIYCRQHNTSGYYRINSSIGYDNRIGNWQNNLFEIMELDGDAIISTGNMTRY